jgi:spoIIIJ-associated protein
MIRIEAITLEDAYKDAASSLQCSVTELAVEVVQHPKSGFLGLFKKKAIIVATLKNTKEINELDESDESDDETAIDPLEYTANYSDEFDEDVEENEDEKISQDIQTLAKEIEVEINELFKHICFDIDKIEVSAYTNDTIMVEFKGKDAALLIGKEGYRYKALSYMIFNWINAKYDVGLRLEIAEFLKNQEDSVNRYLEGVYESIERDGRAQTKILDGVLVQIALKELRERYPQKYVVIRSTKDGLKYIIINDYHN